MKKIVIKEKDDLYFEYLPTQYITDLIQSLGYEGIIYGSTISADGYNLAAFNPTSFKFTELYRRIVKSLNISNL